MLRGGSFNNNADNARSAYRNNNHPEDRNNNIGFRAASTLRRTSPSLLPEFAGRRFDRAPCGACQVQSPGRRPVSDHWSPAESKTGPAGPVGREFRTPRRAIYSR